MYITWPGEKMWREEGKLFPEFTGCSKKKKKKQPTASSPCLCRMKQVIRLISQGPLLRLKKKQRTEKEQNNEKPYGTPITGGL